VIVASSATQLGRVAPSTSGNVLTSTGSAWASAVPADSGRRNLLYNGEMRLAQRQTSVAGLGAAAGYFTTDRWKISPSGTAGRFTMAQIADGPAGFANCTKLSCTTADASIAAGEHLILGQSLEGQDLQQIKKGTASAEQLTVSFWVKGNASATYIVELVDTDNNRKISKSFSVTTSWAKITLLIPADTTGALNDDNATSLALYFWLHAGSNYTSGTLNADAWGAPANANRAAGISSFLDATSRTFFLTGVQLELGATATEFDYRTFGDELRRCQRYFEKSEPYAIPLTQNNRGSLFPTGRQSIPTGEYLIRVPYLVTKRAAPTVTTYPYGTAANTTRWSNGTGTDFAASSAHVAGITEGAFSVINNSGGTIDTGSQIICIGSWYASADL